MRTEPESGTAPVIQGSRPDRRPRLGFLGLGWIGRSRLEALVPSGCADVVALADPCPEMRAAASALAPEAALAADLDGLLGEDLDGVVIATPSAQHAVQAIATLQSGLAVFCQKPLGRSAVEVAEVVAAARQADRLLRVDFSYRHVAAMQRLREVIATGGIGDVFAVDLVFHNAYGPDKPWFYDASLSGGGCLMDLGVHLVDALLWVLGLEGARVTGGTLFGGGRRLRDRASGVEDFASARLSIASGAEASLACSWKLHAGQDAVISATFHGTTGGLRFQNVSGSFYDFALDHHRGTASERLVDPPDDWGGRALVTWARDLGRCRSYEPAAEEIAAVAKVVDEIYAAATSR